MNRRRKGLGRLWTMLSPFVTIGIITFLAHYVVMSIVLDGAMQGSGTSMAHGPTRMPGIDDDNDYAKELAIKSPEEVITFVEGRRTGYEVAGDHGDVISFWPYGVRASLFGPVQTDPKVEAPDVRSIHLHGVRHRALVWVEFNETTGTFDVPSLGLANVSKFILHGVGYWNEFANAYVRANLSITLVEFGPSGEIEHPIGNYSGFITKGDLRYIHDQNVVGKNDDGTYILSNYPLVKPKWIGGKVVEVIDAETLQPIHDAALVAFIVGESLIFVFALRRNRGAVAAILRKRKA